MTYDAPWQCGLTTLLPGQLASPLPTWWMDPRDLALLANLQKVVIAAEVADRKHSTVITRVRLAHAKSMYVRACALIHAAEAEVKAKQPVG